MKNKLIKFFKGRNGFDELNYFLFNFYIIILLINIFFKNNIIEAIDLLIAFTTIYRSLSKNLYLRNKENIKFMRTISKIKKIFSKEKYIYKKCHKCKTTLRLPLPEKIGIKHSTCPECKKRNTYLILKRRK